MYRSVGTRAGSRGPSTAGRQCLRPGLQAGSRRRLTTIQRGVTPAARYRCIQKKSIQYGFSFFYVIYNVDTGHDEDTFTLDTQTHHTCVHRTDHSAPADPTSRLTVRRNPGSPGTARTLFSSLTPRKHILLLPASVRILGHVISPDCRVAWACLWSALGPMVLNRYSGCPVSIIRASAHTVW